MGEHAGTDQGDAVLIAGAREGDGSACGALRARHGRAALRLAGLLTGGSAEAEAAVDRAFAGVFEILRHGGGPSDAFRPFLLTTLRRGLAGHRDEEGEAFDPDVPFVDPALAGLERRPMVRAYLSLPERWRAVLWHTAVEGASPARVLPLFGIGADGVTALAHRAREGLRQAYLRLHPVEEQPEECRPVLDKLRVHLRGDLPDRESARIRRHLGECARCRTTVADLREVDGRLPDVAALVLGTAAAGYLVPRGPGRPFRWAGAVLAAWWWRASPARRKRALAAGTLAVALTAGLLAWPMSGSEPAARPEGADKARLEGGTRVEGEVRAGEDPYALVLPPSRRAQTDRKDGSGSSPGLEPGQSTAARAPGAPLPSAPLPPRPVEPWAAPALEARVGTAGVLLPGRTGIVVLTVWNAGNVRSGEVVAEVSLPRGVRPDGPADAGWSCLPAERALRCVHVPLPPGGGSSARLPVAVASHAREGAAPAVRLAGSPAHKRGRGRASTGVSAAGLPARFVADGRVRLTTAGNVLLTCPRQEAECGMARQRRGVRLDNDQWEMGPLDLDGADDTRTSSPAVLEVPGRVRWAGLYWSGVTGRDAARAREYTARLRGPTGGYRTVEASRVDRFDLYGQRAYQAFAEVTEQVRQGGRGHWWVADVPALEGRGTYAGWHLVVVADDPRAEPGRTVVLDGARPVGVPGATRLRFPLGGLPRGSPARIGLLAWEGDAARAGDRVLLDGRPLSPPNAFTSTLPDRGGALAFGMDAVSYEAELADPSVLEVASTADAAVVGVITISAPSRR